MNKQTGAIDHIKQPVSFLNRKAKMPGTSTSQFPKPKRRPSFEALPPERAGAYLFLFLFNRGVLGMLGFIHSFGVLISDFS